MYFKDRDNTNIDKEFNNNSIVSNIFNFIKKYKIIIIILLILVLSIIIVSLFISNKNNIETTYLILNGDEVVTIYEGDDYVDPGFKAYNSKNIDLSSDVNISSNLNNKKIGEYEINYTIGNVTKTRKVNVIEKTKVYTYIYLKPIDNNINIFLKIGEEYVEPGYKVYSSTGDNLNDKVKISGTVDILKKGNYKVTYSLIDSDGVTVTTSRMVIVMDTEIDLSLSTSEYTNTDITINVNVIDDYFDYMILPDGSKVNENTYSYKVSKNGKYSFKTYNTKGLEKTETIEVNNIDKVGPTGSCSGSYKDGVSTINVSAKDDIEIMKYEINGTSYTGSKITINKELTNVSVKIYDKAGNSKSVSCELENKNFYVSLDDISPEYPSKKLDGFPNVSVNYYNDFTYWVYYPVKFVDNLPIVVFIGGLGHVGNDYENGKKTAIRGGPIDQVIKNGVEYDAIVVTLQVPRKNSEDTVYKYTHKYISLLNKLVDKFNADKNRISIMGYSHGCFGVMTIVNQYPKYFSAAVPVGCTWNQTSINSRNFINQPIWAISSTFDGNYDGHVSLKTFVNKINERGGNAKYTHLNKNHDDLFRDSYSVVSDSNLDIINWMISHKKNK